MRNPPPDLFVERLGLCLAKAEEAGTSIADVAKAIGVHRSVIYLWKDGKGSPEGTSLASAADYFGVTMDWLWGRADPKDASAIREGAAGLVKDSERIGAQADRQPTPASRRRRSRRATDPPVRA